MPASQSAAMSNRLVAALPAKQRERFVGGCRMVTLVLAEPLAEPHERIRRVYFPMDGFISQTAVVDGRSHLEVGLVGDEGMLGISLLLGVEVAPLHALVQGAGEALCMEAGSFRRELATNAVLERVLKRYLYVVMAQTAQTAACTHFHLIEARLARWLLMSRDRSHADTFHVTHEFLAYMLGARRAGVTRAANSLQQSHLIRYHRGDVTVLDNSGLEAAACECYSSDNARYSQVMGKH